jgi:ATP-dependent protease ClpP protease subunit
MEEDKIYEYDNIQVEGSEIFFHCDVSNESVNELCRSIRKIEREQGVMGIKNPQIHIHIKSDGGCLYSGLAAMDFLKHTCSHVTTIAEGMCASAATFIFLAGDSRIILPNCYILIHQLSDTFWGTFEHLKDEMKQCKKVMRQIKKIYLEETTIPEEKLDLLMTRNLYFSARKCIKFGLGLPPSQPV